MSLELVLNLVWLTVAGVVFFTALRSRQCDDEKLHHWVTFFAAVLCLVVLIFPAISISDDYHAEVCLLDDTTKRVAHSIDVNAGHSVAVVAVATVVLVSSPGVCVQRLNFDPSAESTSRGFVSRSIGRAPPLSTI